jgi:RNA polymerase sigma factor (sigma-70 family)
MPTREDLLNCYPSMMRYAFNRVGNKPDAEDLVQTAIMKILQNFDNLPDETLLYYAIRTVKNCLIDKYRHRMRASSVYTDSEYEIAAVLHSDLEHDPTISIDLKKALRILNRIGGRCREILLLHGEGYKYEEISALLSLATGTIKSAMHRCRRQMYEAAPDLSPVE